jgi:ribose 5-phosphate isomerase B
MKIILGADHGGFALKEEIKKALLEKGYALEDLGAFDTGASDYPDYGRLVGEAVAQGRGERGIVVCGTGIGVSIAANKINGIRAALCGDAYSARMSRLHNDANVLALGQRVTGAGLALDIVEIWLGASFEGGRHALRVAKLMALESLGRDV